MHRLAAMAALLPLLTTCATAQVLENRQAMRMSTIWRSSHPAVRGDTLCLHGSFVHAGHTTSLEQFVQTPEEDVRGWLTQHLQPGGHLQEAAARIDSGEVPVLYVILDIEREMHPSTLWKLWDTAYTPVPPFTKREIADAFAMRLRVTQEVFAQEFPLQEVRVALFSTLKPHPYGWPTDDYFVKQRDNLVELAAMGMLDDADFLVPLVYPRFHSTHVRYTRLTEYVNQALDGSSEILRSDGSSMPMMPLLTLRLNNRGVPPGFARVSWMQDVLDLIRDSGHDIEAIGFWLSPTETDECVNRYFDRLFATQDWNYDCLSNETDDSLVAGAIFREDPMADLNRDGFINDLDWEFYRDHTTLPPVTAGCGPTDDCPCKPDIFDFLNFQELFIMGDPSADLNGDGSIDFFDFIAFQEAAADPCP